MGFNSSKYAWEYFLSCWLGNHQLETGGKGKGAFLDCKITDELQLYQGENTILEYKRCGISNRQMEMNGKCPIKDSFDILGPILVLPSKKGSD